MRESLERAERQLKRVDHLIYVSLKYTRTVDILKNTVGRIIEAYDAAILSLLEFMKEKAAVEEIPKSPGLRTTVLKGKFGADSPLNGFLDHYLRMREVFRSDFDSREEFRRNVTMIAKLKGEVIEITIDSITGDYKKVKTFVALVKEYVGREGQGDLKEMLDHVELELEFDKRY